MIKEREHLVATTILSLLILTWLGFFLHRSPRFAGSGIGMLFGIVGAALMLLPLGYALAKRAPYLHTQITPHISMQSLMTLHVFTGIVGPLFAIIHTGHKFNSWLGITLIAVMLFVVVSGFTVRYLLIYVSHEIKDKLVLLQTARGDLDAAWGVVETTKTPTNALQMAPGVVSIIYPSIGAAADVTRIADSVADLEYSIRMDEFFKRWFSRSLKLHILLSVVFYLLLGSHIFAGVQYGLRGFS